MRGWWDRITLLVIVVVAGFSIYAVWPDEPHRYLPDFIPLPSGRGLPGTLGPLKLPCHTNDTSQGDTGSKNPATNCKGMTLGLDLQGGSRIKLQADASGTNLTAAQIDDGLNAAKQVIENRINPFGVSESQVQRSGSDGLTVELPGVSAQTARDITRPAVLMFCEGLQQGGQGAAGSPIATVQDGSKIYYKPGTCEPDVDPASGQVALKSDDGSIAKNADGTIQRVEPSYSTSASRTPDNIVWTPAKGDLNGTPTIMTGNFLKPDSSITFDTIGRPVLQFSMTGDGQKIFGSLSRRIGDPQQGLPLATFLDGEPIRGKDNSVIAPVVQSEITSTGSTTGLTLNDAQRLKTFLNNGAFPIPLKVIQQHDVDATLGDQAVLHSVQAGLIARLGRSRTVVLSSHLLTEVTQLCRRVVVLDRGALIADRTVDELVGGGGTLEEAYLRLVRE